MATALVLLEANLVCPLWTSPQTEQTNGCEGSMHFKISLLLSVGTSKWAQQILARFLQREVCYDRENYLVCLEKLKDRRLQHLVVVLRLRKKLEFAGDILRYPLRENQAKQWEVVLHFPKCSRSLSSLFEWMHHEAYSLLISRLISNRFWDKPLPSVSPVLKYWCNMMLRENLGFYLCGRKF